MTTYLSFLGIAFLLIIVPGPDYLLLTKNTLTYGVTGGFQTLFGILSALFCHTFLAVFGLSALLMQSALLFQSLKILGALYLIFLGIQTLLRPQKVTSSDTQQKQNSLFFQGLFTNLLNPKVIVFFLTFLPQFVPAQHANWLSFLQLGLSYLIGTCLLYGLYIVFLGKMRRFLERPQVKHTIEKVSGFILLLFGIRLLSKKL